MWPPQLRPFEHLPPARFNYARGLTLAYARTRLVAVVHWVGRQRQQFTVVGCRPGWELQRSDTFGSLTHALLIGGETEGIRLADWEMYEPPRGQKLFTEHDPRWLRRRHRVTRQAFIALQCRVRPSRRFVRRVAELRRSGPAT